MANKVKWTDNGNPNGNNSSITITCDVSETSSDSSIDFGNADRYVFEVSRLKDIATKEEFIKIDVFDGKIDDETKMVVKASSISCANIEKATITELEAKLVNLRLYGVMMKRGHFPTLRQHIEANYRQLKPNPINNVGTQLTLDIVQEIYDMFVRYIRDVGMEPREIAGMSLYNIPVDEFKDHLVDSIYGKYKYADVRTELANLEIEMNGESVRATKCSYGRNDNTVTVGEGKTAKRVKVISFIQKVVDYRITKLPEV